jgi:hypothetical protein
MALNLPRIDDAAQEMDVHIGPPFMFAHFWQAV